MAREKKPCPNVIACKYSVNDRRRCGVRFVTRSVFGDGSLDLKPATRIADCVDRVVHNWTGAITTIVGLHSYRITSSRHGWCAWTDPPQCHFVCLPARPSHHHCLRLSMYNLSDPPSTFFTHREAVRGEFRKQERDGRFGCIIRPTDLYPLERRFSRDVLAEGRRPEERQDGTSTRYWPER